jgi:hypothetical protein
MAKYSRVWKVMRKIQAALKEADSISIVQIETDHGLTDGQCAVAFLKASGEIIVEDDRIRKSN